MKYMSDKDTFETNEFSCGMDNESDIAGHERNILMGHFCNEMTIYHPVSSIKNE